MTAGQPGHLWASLPFPQHLQPIKTGGSRQSSPKPQGASSQMPIPQVHSLQSTIAMPHPVLSALPRRNEVDLSRERLIEILESFSQIVASQFQHPIRLVVHGGACMLLHPLSYQASLEQKEYLPRLSHHRKTTRDVDYIARSFVTEMAHCGVPHAGQKLQHCIVMTAHKFQLGLDWMNSDADVALPMATASNGVTYDPIYHASVSPNNIELHSIFHSSNKMLTLVSVSPFWAVALKLVRYSPQDASDICLLLRNGIKLSGTQWSRDTLRNWLYEMCWSMGYANYDRERLQTFNSRIDHALQMLAEWQKNERERPNTAWQPMTERAFASVNVMPTPSVGVSQLAAMGGSAQEVSWSSDGKSVYSNLPQWASGATRRTSEPSRSSLLGPNSESTRKPAEFYIANWTSDNPHLANGAAASNGKSPQSSPPDQSRDVQVMPKPEISQPIYDDPYDYSVAGPVEDSAARKARKKKRKELEKGRSQSLPAASFQDMPALVPPPPLPKGMPPPPPDYFNSKTSTAVRATSPWQLQPGEPRDLDVTGLASFRDLTSALSFAQNESAPSLDQALHSPHSQAPIGAPHDSPFELDANGPAWRRPEKPKKSKDKDKRKKDKEQEKERKRNRSEKRTASWTCDSRVPTMATTSDTETEDEETSDEHVDHSVGGTQAAAWSSVLNNTNRGSRPSSFYPPGIELGDIQGQFSQSRHASRPGSQHHSPVRQSSRDNIDRSRPPSPRSRTPLLQVSSPPPTAQHPSTYPGMVNPSSAPPLKMVVPSFQNYETTSVPPNSHANSSKPNATSGKKSRQNTVEEPPFIPPPPDAEEMAATRGSGRTETWASQQHATGQYVQHRHPLMMPPQHPSYSYHYQQQANGQIYGRPY